MIGRPVTFGHPANAAWQYGDAPPASSVPNGFAIIVWQAGHQGVVKAFEGWWYDERGRVPWGQGSPHGYWCEYLEPVIPIGTE